jgi:oligopeptide transport system ATP-binding protein
LDSSLILSVRNLKTHFKLDEGILKAVDGVDFDIRRRKTLGIIGESGCGKSVTAFSIMRTVTSPGKIVAGSMEFELANNEIVDLAQLNPASSRMRSIRGKEISMIFQEPITSLSPVHTIGDQITEMILLHRTKNKNEAKEIGIEMLNKVGLANPKQVFGEYPHMLSGGMCQRAMIAQALSCNPALLIADEPTTALDVTIQAQIVELVVSMREQLGMAVVWITNDLGVVAGLADRVVVMYAGYIVEEASVLDLYEDPRHPYTQALLAALPRADRRREDRLKSISGAPPNLLVRPTHCPFAPRCEFARDRCWEENPLLDPIAPGHTIACWIDVRTGELR